MGQLSRGDRDFCYLSRPASTVYPVAMVAHVTFIGDRVSAAGFRLGGAEVMVPAPGQVVTALQAALGSADLVVMTAECASQVPGEMLQRAYSSLHPLFLVVPDVQGRVAPDDSVARMRRQLGMAE